MKCSCCHENYSETLTLWDFFSSYSGRCFRCQQLFRPVKSRQRCLGCGRETSQKICEDCQQWQVQLGFLIGNRALFHYDDGFAQWIEDYKYKGDYRLKSAFAREIHYQLKQVKQTIICPLPISQERFESRGFNQVIGCLTAAKINYQELLERPRNDSPQANKKRMDRLKLQQPFTMRVSLEKMRNKKIILIDDVYTTGRTLYHAAELLLENGAKSVTSFTFAR